MAEIVLAGAHGGAGVTTLASLLPPAWDLGAPRRTGGGVPPVLLSSRPVVLVTRNTVAAAGRAVIAATTIIRAGGRIAVLAVVSDGLPEPAEAAYRFRLLEERVGDVVRVPFIPALRLTDQPATVQIPRRARRAIAAIRNLATAASAARMPTAQRTR